MDKLPTQLIIVISSIILLLISLFYANKMLEMKKGEPNSLLAYHFFFDLFAFGLTALVIILAFSEIGLEDDISTFVLGAAIGSLLTRTPSFKENERKGNEPK
ncbi:MAG: hypothetical protein WC897_03075 [Candidatus Gracilibacteria bacterium]